ncbi:hypothetical protein E2C01_022670 [Portunus trituberculatus]|uniref:Uncharacterized protein n=1 Tax=Portunus trituberculatus TaxID=210409 RepID=A0A5B7E5Y9_PORTR|nr:hypothetical protein [Portunus trituberculatus]
MWSQSYPKIGLSALSSLRNGEDWLGDQQVTEVSLSDGLCVVSAQHFSQFNTIVRKHNIKMFPGKRLCTTT